MTDSEPFYSPQVPPLEHTRTLRDLQPPVIGKEELNKLEIKELPYASEGITTLKDWHRIFAEMQLMGKRNVDIARELGVHEMTLARVQRSPVYRIYIKDIRKRAEEDSVFDVAAHLKRVTPKVFETLEHLMMNAESETVRASMVKEYADRISPKVTRIEAETKNVVYLESETIQMLAKNLMESTSLTGKEFDDKSDDEIIDILDLSIEKGKPDEDKQE